MQWVQSFVFCSPSLNSITSCSALARPPPSGELVHAGVVTRGPRTDGVAAHAGRCELGIAEAFAIAILSAVAAQVAGLDGLQSAVTQCHTRYLTGAVARGAGRLVDYLCHDKRGWRFPPSPFLVLLLVT